ncbi:MAG: hypothetical protein IPH07_04485 [Deltaproteobacteria bacterium]|nr:hypothetical protein [Deltaproteobacteria bacterium]MBK8237740.1 hypothetical protein [Deltaproteobacteria bacterium]MBK8720111.1 hypothetical protein [Deltaproteobacteria bacterium]MBP7289086.1 hypothetical protein [Nannocystaceae bacterium]
MRNTKLITLLPSLAAVVLLSACPGDSEETTTTNADTSTTNDSSDDDPSVTLTTTNSTTADTTDATTDATTTATTTTMTTDPTGDSSGTTDPTDTSTTDPTNGSSSSGSGGSSSTGTMSDCAQVTATEMMDASNNPGLFFTQADDLIGDDMTLDQFTVVLANDDGGTFDLSMAPDDNLSTCEHCVVLLEDADAMGVPTRIYFQSEGSVEYSGLPVAGGFFSSTFTGVRLVEVTIDDMGVSTVVDGGGCVDIVDGLVGTAPVIDGWTCNPAYYGDDECDCGCGIADTDCADGNLSSCLYCNDPGSCSDATCMNNPDIVPDDNAVCM